MNLETIKKVLGFAVETIEFFIPEKKYLIFPLLISIIEDAIKKRERSGEIAFSLPVFINPDIVETKPDKFIMNFFTSNAELKNYYEPYVKNKDISFLRQRFNTLYPILGLNDPFLRALFKKEIEKNEFEKIFECYEERLKKAKEDTEPLRMDKDFRVMINKILKEIFNLGLSSLDKKEIRKILLEEIKKKLHE
ncbi:MAG: hypothetical protein AB1410_06790 [Acidobacteriota bacterium]